MIVRKALLLGTIAYMPLSLAIAQSAPGDQRPELTARASGDVPTTSTSINPEVQSERWNLFYQATSIGQYHGAFPSPYEGANSLQSYPERDLSLNHHALLRFAVRPKYSVLLRS